MQLTLSSAWRERGVIYIASYLGLASSIDLQVASENGVIEFKNGSNTYKEYVSVILSLVESSKHGSTLVGLNDHQKAEVYQWLTYCSNNIVNGIASSSQLQDINSYLSLRSFITGNNLTIGDVALYWTLYPALDAISIKDASTLYPHVTRWFNYIQGDSRINASNMKLPIKAFKAVTSLPCFPLNIATSSSSAPAEVDVKTNKKEKDGNGVEGKKTKNQVDDSKKVKEVVEVKTDVKKEKSNDAKKEKVKTEGGETKKDVKKEKKEKESDSKKEEDQSPISRCDIRVGFIKSAKKHPDSEKLYVEEIDVGEEKPRQIVSGLAHFVPLEALINKKVLVLCNLKSQTMAGVPSEGMVLCASNDDHTKVELLDIPNDSKVGERITFVGHEGEPSPPNFMNKKKVFPEKVAPFFVTNSDRVVNFNGVIAMTSGGHIMAPSLVGAHIG